MLDRVTLTEVESNVKIVNSLGKSYSNMSSEKESDTSMVMALSVMMQQSYFFDLLLYSVEILDTDELLYLSSRVIVLISRAGIK